MAHDQVDISWYGVYYPASPPMSIYPGFQALSFPNKEPGLYDLAQW